MQIRKIEQLIEEVRACLPEYLQMHGREAGGKKNFRCPNESYHKNGDAKPSANLVPGSNNTIFKCFTCGSGDIFHAAHYLEGKPLRGPGFVQETLLYLADKFRIPYEEDANQREVIDAYRYAERIIAEGIRFKTVREYLENRGFTGIAEYFGIGGTVFKEFITELSTKYKDDFLRAIDLTRGDLFDRRLVFPIHNEYGQTVAFASRQLLDDGKAKYLNSSNKAYEKGKTLYNIHRVEGEEIILVEGYADVWQLAVNGVYNAAAICSASLSIDQVELLQRQGFKRIVLCFDGDRAGQDGQKKAIALLENQQFLSVHYVQLPPGQEDKDPDGYITKHGIDKFNDLPRYQVETATQKEKTAFAEEILRFEEECWERDGLLGFKLPWAYLTERLDGIQNGLYLVGGLSNIGKTTFMLQMALGLAMTNDDVFVLYFSIDDSNKKVIPRLVASLVNMPINWIANPKQYITHSQMTDAEKKTRTAKRQEGISKIYQLAKNSMSVKDASSGHSIEYIDHTISVYQEITGKKVAVFIDNFHKITTKQYANDQRTKYTYLSETVKRLVNKYDVPVVCTVELRKLNHNGRPELDDIKESVDIIYDSDCIFLLHNDFHSKQGSTKLTFQDPVTFQDMPILEVSVAKNKLSGFKGRDYFRLYPNMAKVEECGNEGRKNYTAIDI